MNKFFTGALFALLFLATTALSAQDRPQRGDHAQDRERPTPEQRAEKQTKRLTTLLELTPEQARKVAAINQQYAQKQAAQMEKMKAQREAARANRKAVKEEQHAAITAVLTSEQREKLETLHAQRKERGEKRGPRKGRRNRD